MDAVAFVWCEESILEHFICGRTPDGHIKRMKYLLLVGDGVNFYLQIALTRLCFYSESNTFVIANVNLESQNNIRLTLRLSCFQAEKTRNFVSRSFAVGEVLSTVDMATAVKCGIIYWLFGGAVRNLGRPSDVTKWLQPLQMSAVRAAT